MSATERGGRLILDAGALLALARGDQTARAVTILAARRGMTVIVPTVVVAQVIRGVPGDASVNRILKDVDEFVTLPLPLARQAGLLLRLSETTDVVDAAVSAITLAELPATILTSDPGDMRRLIMNDAAHPRVQIIAI